MTGNQQIPFITAIRCGNRAFASGDGTLLHRSRRAMNLQFGRKVVTVQMWPGILSPSSILVNLPGLPDVEEAYFDGNVMTTDRFAVKIGSPEDLRFRGRPGFNPRSAARSLRPWIRPYDHSIAKAMLIYLFNLEVSSHGLEKEIVVRQERAFRESRSLAELASRLVGIGYGLTPSGDDFILGVIAALSLQGRDFSGLGTIIHAYDNPFSRTILEDASSGCFSEPLLALMNSLAGGTCPPEAAEALLRVGSTSGRDTLAGMYFGFYQTSPGSAWEPGTGTAALHGATG
jgi:hypothetical protein